MIKENIRSHRKWEWAIADEWEFFWPNLVFMNFKCVFCASFTPPQLQTLYYSPADFVQVILVVREQK